MKKLVHSLWTQPYLSSNFRVNGGYKNQYYFFLSAVLSFHSFKKSIPNSKFELVTDDYGKQLLVDELGLPYDSVDLKLNNVMANNDVWSIGKLHAFQQDEPFLHVDFDAYLFKPLSDKFLNADVIVCNDENDYPIYNNSINQIVGDVIISDNIYKNVFNDYELKNSVCSYNMGIFGGNNVKLIKEYSERSLKMFELNKYSFLMGNNPALTCFIEQIYLAYFLKEKNVLPDCLLEYNWIHNQKEHIKSASNVGFTHLVAESKKNSEILKSLENRVKEDHPEYFQKLQILKNRCLEIYDLKIK